MMKLTFYRLFSVNTQSAKSIDLESRPPKPRPRHYQDQSIKTKTRPRLRPVEQTKTTNTKNC